MKRPEFHALFLLQKSLLPVDEHSLNESANLLLGLFGILALICQGTGSKIIRKTKQVTTKTQSRITDAITDAITGSNYDP